MLPAPSARPVASAAIPGNYKQRPIAHGAPVPPWRTPATRRTARVLTLRRGVLYSGDAAGWIGLVKRRQRASRARAVSGLAATISMGMGLTLFPAAAMADSSPHCYANVYKPFQTHVPNQPGKPAVQVSATYGCDHTIMERGSASIVLQRRRHHHWVTFASGSRDTRGIVAGRAYHMSLASQMCVPGRYRAVFSLIVPAQASQPAITVTSTGHSVRIGCRG